MSYVLQFHKIGASCLYTHVWFLWLLHDTHIDILAITYSFAGKYYTPWYYYNQQV